MRFGSKMARVRFATAVVAVSAALLSTPPTAVSSVPAASPPAVIPEPVVIQGPLLRPNIVLISTDDQRLHDLRYMPSTRRLLLRRGTSFTGLSPNPLCCPARAEILTGQQSFNNGVRSNRGELGGYGAFDPSQTIATWLEAAGYTTIFLGKYLNGYNRMVSSPRDPGWDSWHPTTQGIYKYRQFTVSHNGYQQEVSQYQTDYFTELGVQQIRTYAPRKAPFFLWQSYVAPHGSCEVSEELRCWTPPDIAKRHADLFRDEPLDTRQDPAFNEGDVSDKPRQIQRRSRFDRDQVRHLTQMNRKRLRALRAVDEGVAAMVEELRRAGELERTLIIFTSDNGYLLGEHRLSGKTWGYEQSLQVPLLMRGPGVPAGLETRKVATLLDIPATIVAAARATPTLALDGQDLMPVAQGLAPGAETVLIQSGPRNPAESEAGWMYRGVRTSRYTYLRYAATGEVELYDRKADPYQLQNVADDPRYSAVLHELERRTAFLESCTGLACQARFGRVPGPST